MLPAVLLFFGALTFSAKLHPVELRSVRNVQGLRCPPLKVAQMQTAPEMAQSPLDLEGHGSASGGFRKTSVGQLLFLDAALLAAAFFINLKCARKLQGMLIPDAFWGRLFIWV